jgi:peptide/nickel transport system substrate-binding protein/oligopeptide transport system substrate-binding protein
MRKKTFIVSQALLLMGVLALILAGCGNGSSGSNLAANQKFIEPNVGTQDVKTLDPALVTDLNSSYALDLIDSGLVTLDAKTLKVVPDLASNWGVSPDGKTYTFHIRPGLKFSNGDPLTAQDFAYSIDRAFSPAIFGKSYTPDYYLGGQGGVNAGIVGGEDRGNGKIPTMIGPGKGLVVVDPQTLQINITKPALWFLDALTYPVSWPVDQKVVDQYGANWYDGHFVGTGPFQLTSWQHKVQLTFKQNPNWYGKKPTLTEIDMPMIADPNTAWNQFQAKEVDTVGVPSADYKIAKALGPSEFFEGPSLSIFYVAPNSKVPPFDNLTVRQAFAEATDRDTLAHQVLQDTVLPSDHIVPEGMPGYNPNLKGLPFNPQDAKTKLTSVYPDVTKMPAVTLEYPKGGDNDKIAAKLQQDYQTYLGVHINLNPVDFGQLLNDTESRNSKGIFPVQFYMLGWIADYPDPQDWLDLVVTTSSSNNMNFSNSQVDSLVAQADSSTDANGRLALYNQAEEIAIDNVAWIPFEQGKNIYVFQKWVQGLVVDAQGLTPDISIVNVQILQH